MSVTGNGGGQRQAAKCLGSSLDPVSSEQDRLEQAVVLWALPSPVSQVCLGYCRTQNHPLCRSKAFQDLLPSDIR